MSKILLMVLLGFSVIGLSKEKATKVLMKTSLGDVTIELFPKKAPITVKNFLSYVDKSFYNDLTFHRVIKNFMVQGGGFDVKMKQKSPAAPIKNEANNGLTNDMGTIAMARTPSPHSATSQFFINVNNNEFLNYQSEANMGYAVFGRVVSGMDVLKRMQFVKTTIKNGHRDVPSEPILIKSITRL